jgi:hypothetical protein
MVRKAVLDRSLALRSRGKFLNGPPARLLRVLLDRHGPEATLIAIARVPAEVHGPPGYVEAVADILGAGDDGAAEREAATYEMSAETLRARLEGVKQHMAAFADFGGDIPDKLQHEHDQLVTQLAELDEGAEALTSTGPVP